MLLPLLAERTRYFKETPEGVEYMCKAMEERCNEVAKMKSYEIALNLLTIGTLNDETIAKATGLSVEEISQIKTQVKLVAE